MPTVNVNGNDLYYTMDDFADPWEPHDTIFMQHYVFGNHTEFRAWVPTLARGYSVIRMDRRGNGYSSKPPMGYEYNLEDLLSDFRLALDALGLERVHYVGASLGGVLGVAFAATHPERVKSLVLCGTPCWIKPETQRGFVREGYPDGTTSVMVMGSRSYAFTGRLRSLGSDASHTQVMRAVYTAEQSALMPPNAIASLMRMVSQREFDITPMLPEVKAPTLLLSPRSSPHTSLEEQRRMKEAIPNCQQVIFEGAAHSISTDMPDRCARKTLRFVRQYSG